MVGKSCACLVSDTSLRLPTEAASKQKTKWSTPFSYAQDVLNLPTTRARALFYVLIRGATTTKNGAVPSIFLITSYASSILPEYVCAWVCVCVNDDMPHQTGYIGEQTNKYAPFIHRTPPYSAVQHHLTTLDRGCANETQHILDILPPFPSQPASPNLTSKTQHAASG